MRLPVTIIAALLAASPLDAQMVSIPLGGPRRERPSPNAALLGSRADIAAAVAAKGRPQAMTSLDGQRRPTEVLQFLGLPLGARVLDVVAGNGYFSEIIGQAIGPNGRVTAVVGPSMLHTPDERAAMIALVGRVPNVTIAAATPETIQIAANSLDFVLVHDLDQSRARSAGNRADPAFLAKVFAAVRPGGIVGFVDHAAGPNDRGAVNADAEALKIAFLHAGFVLDSQSRLSSLPTDQGTSPDDVVDHPIDGFVFRFIKPE